ncbi:BTB/POZ domain-containing protein 2 [Hypsizygus marmoreus]|uniref:BTB/POZ domain-containing protein 2 n=1 Tax=Hypsizygus marmoreus TaxID=39966 RepID=A0A369JUS4_HYPMA|nr:BTB/POZ domain-containing protein 2 [Hypsizygus marmoreus]
MSSLPSSSGSVNGRNGHTNGASSHSNSDAGLEPADGGLVGSQYPVNGFSQPPYQNHHNEDIVNHLYHAGFQTGNYADTILHVHQNVYRLHAIILSRSPLLAHLMSTSPQTSGQRVIYVPLDQEPEVTQEGFAIALGYLYSAISLNLIRPDNARAVLAAGCLLGGMDDLCSYAYEVCKQSITVDTISSWVEFIDTIPSSSDGSTTPDLPKTSIFGHYAQRLKDDVFHFLVDTLPEILEVQQSQPEPSSPGPSGRDVLLQIYSRVPFEMFKTAVESPAFRLDPTGSDQARFKFAKDAIELRKRGIARGSGAEETVVLAFGGGNFGGSTVHITRKMRKRPLWKVNAYGDGKGWERVSISEHGTVSADEEGIDSATKNVVLLTILGMVPDFATGF